MTPTLETDSLIDQIDVIDVDTHVIEPADLWTSRAPSKFLDLVPRIASHPETGNPHWLIGDQFTHSPGYFARAGWPNYPPSFPVGFDDIDPGSWRAPDRLKRMDEYGIYAQVLYPNLIGFDTPLFMQLGSELSILCTQIYNDFLIDFASADPNRFIPIAMVPFWDLEAAIAEINRSRDLGHKGVLFANKFEKIGLPGFTDPYWDPIYSALQDLEMPVNYHVGFSSSPSSVLTRIEAKSQGPEFSRTQARSSASTVMSNAETTQTLLTSDLCERFPRLRFVSVESGFGYVPYLIESLDWHWKGSGAYRDFPTLPSEYFRRQCYGSFWFEQQTLALLELYPDNFMFETDYPHPTSLSPGPASPSPIPKDHIRSAFANLAPELTRKVLHDNAVSVYGLR